jgi:hypothetical protein
VPLLAAARTTTLFVGFDWLVVARSTALPAARTGKVATSKAALAKATL